MAVMGYGECCLMQVVLFSGGLENFHGRLPISFGERTLMQFWFRCSSSPGSTDHDI